MVLVSKSFLVLCNYREGLVVLSMFDRLFKKNENTDAVGPSEKKRDTHIDNNQLTPEEAQQYWAKIASKIIVSTLNCVDHTSERIFILISFDEKDPTMDIFFQMNGQVRMWNDLDNTQHKNIIAHNLLPQVDNIVKQAHCLYDRAHLTRMAYTQIQFEFESKTWYLHDISEESMEAQLDKYAAFLKWFDDVSHEIKQTPLDSKKKITWGPFKPIA